MSVPKVIHYCWFGHNELSPKAKNAIASWERFAPGYEIRRCDESTLDIAACSWAEAAYAAKRYAFVADYARFKMLYEVGGVYMDLGSELIRDITDLVDTYSPFSAIEELSKTANTGLCVAAQRHNPVVANVLKRYESTNFVDEPEFLRAHTVNEMFTQELEQLGYVREDRMQVVGEWTLLPSEAFNPVYGFGGYHIRKGTYSIHHYSASWESDVFKEKRRVVNAITPFVGRRAGQVIGRLAGELKYGSVSSLLSQSYSRFKNY